uniref:GPI-anchor transamidase n=1 Tax=Monodelphis domestica TaxID=13616 RepID=A0A5F8GM00_MONDO
MKLQPAGRRPVCSVHVLPPSGGEGPGGVSGGREPRPQTGSASPSLWQGQAEQLFRSGHTNNWAVLVCTSRFWFNYRHVANTLSVYRSVKRLGIPDSHIVLMLADDMACNSRNPKPATVFSHKNMELNVYGDDVEVDYRSYEVTVENFLRVLTGRVPPSTPRSKRLLSDDRSNILIYMTGHGGNGFLKFQDSEEITNVELADAFEQMWQKRRYHEMLFIIDTCQGASMYERFYSPNVMALASSQVGEDSLSHQPDLAIGVHLMDRYTFYVLEFLEEIHPASQANMNDLVSVSDRGAGGGSGPGWLGEARGRLRDGSVSMGRPGGPSAPALFLALLPVSGWSRAPWSRVWCRQLSEDLGLGTTGHRCGPAQGPPCFFLPGAPVLVRGTWAGGSGEPAKPPWRGPGERPPPCPMP